MAPMKFLRNWTFEKGLLFGAVTVVLGAVTGLILESATIPSIVFVANLLLLAFLLGMRPPDRSS